MHTLAIQTRKGGVGKTTVTGNLAHAFALAGIQTIVVDTDPQGNLSEWLMGLEEINPTLVDALSGEVDLEDTIYNLRARENLHIIPTYRFDSLDDFTSNTVNNEPFIFHQLRDGIEALGYDLLIYDCPPGTGNYTKTIVSAADEAMPVMMAKYFSMSGLETFTKFIDDVRKKRRAEIAYNKIVITAIDNRLKSSEDVPIAVRRTGIADHIFEIHTSTIFEKMLPERKTIFEMGNSKDVVKFQEQHMNIAAKIIGEAGLAAKQVG